MSLVFACLLPTLLATSTPAQTAEGRFDIKFLTESQQKELWERVDRTAIFEAAARACGHSTELDERVTSAAQDCLAPETLQRVRWRFHLKLQEVQIPDPRSFCASAEVKDILSSYIVDLDDTISEVRQACVWCKTMGFCR